MVTEIVNILSVALCLLKADSINILYCLPARGRTGGGWEGERERGTEEGREGRKKRSNKITGSDLTSPPASHFEDPCYSPSGAWWRQGAGGG